MPRLKRPIRHVVRTSNRFPQLSSPAWIEFRRDPDNASKRFNALRDHLRPLSVFADLTPTQQVELVGLVGRIHQFALDAALERHFRKQLHKARREAGRRGRKVKAKLENIAEAFRDLASYLDDFGSDIWGDLLLGHGDVKRIPREQQLNPDQLRSEADRYLSKRLLTEAEIDQLAAETRSAAGEAVSNMPVDVTAVRKAITVEIATFFIERCGLGRRESDIRASKIGNAVLGWDLQIREHDESADRKRSAETVRSRRRRARDGQGGKIPH